MSARRRYWTPMEDALLRELYPNTPKLRDPRWQQKRLRIFERDGWMCQVCATKDRTLHVHHIAYSPYGGDPWEVPDTLLFTACDVCHELEHGVHKEMLYQILDMLATMGMRTSIDLFRLVEKVGPACHSLAVETGRPESDFLPTAIGIFIEEWPEEKAKMIADGLYYAKREGPGEIGGAST